MTTWLTDANDNKCSVAYFGSEEAAQKALDSLVECKNCINCTRCSRCYGCSDCSDCSGCSGCRNCSYCSYCTRCSGCSGCSGCSYCSYCTRCSGCSRCYGCSDCSGCSGCSGKKGDFTPPAIPKIENIHSAIFKAASQPDALDMAAPHRCCTTHCRAGWAVHLAGEAGYKLERHYGWCLAAQMIYEKSGYLISPVRFYETNEQAMANMKRLAEIEASRATGEA